MCKRWSAKRCGTLGVVGVGKVARQIAKCESEVHSIHAKVIERICHLHKEWPKSSTMATYCKYSQMYTWSEHQPGSQRNANFAFFSCHRMFLCCVAVISHLTLIALHRWLSSTQIVCRWVCVPCAQMQWNIIRLHYTVVPAVVWQYNARPSEMYRFSCRC